MFLLIVTIHRMSFQFEYLEKFNIIFKANLGHDSGHLVDTVYAHAKIKK
jgi:hypothetical protein